MTHRIALVHAVTVAIDPVAAAFAQLWPQAQTTNLLDDSLSADLARGGGITPALKERFLKLAMYSIDAGAQGLLFTCSAFGSAIEHAKKHLADEHPTLPILKPNEAMLEEALGLGSRLAIIATFAPALTSMKPELLAAATTRGIDLTVQQVHVVGAQGALERGEPEAHDERIAAAAASLRDVDAVLLAQFSMARAAPRVRERTAAQVLTSPESAVLKLKAALVA